MKKFRHIYCVRKIAIFLHYSESNINDKNIILMHPLMFISFVCTEEEISDMFYDNTLRHVERQWPSGYL